MTPVRVVFSDLIIFRKYHTKLITKFASVSTARYQSINQSINQPVYLYGSSKAGLKHAYE